VSSVSRQVGYRGLIRNRKDFSSRHYWLGISIGLFLLFLFALVFVSARIRIINLRYEYTKLTERERDLTDQNKKLKIELATLTSLKQVEKIAKIELKMIHPSKDRVFVVY